MATYRRVLVLRSEVMQGPLIPELFPSSPVTENRDVRAGEVRWPIDPPLRSHTGREESGTIPEYALRILAQPYIGNGRRQAPIRMTAHLAYVRADGTMEVYDMVEIEHTYDVRERSVEYSLRARVYSMYTVSHIVFGAGVRSASEYGLLRLNSQRTVERGDVFSYGYRIPIEVLEMICA